MQSFSDFLAMGGYGGYVWPAYIVVIIVLAGLIVASLRDLAAREREVAELEAASPRRRNDGDSAA